MRLSSLILIGLNVVQQDRNKMDGQDFRNLSDLCLELIELIELVMKIGLIFK